MTDHKPSNPSQDDFSEAAQKSLDAGIADETAAYEKAIDADDADDGRRGQMEVDRRR
jgi:hypothetical protein